jgi:hypothetical protein
VKLLSHDQWRVVGHGYNSPSGGDHATDKSFDVHVLADDAISAIEVATAYADHVYNIRPERVRIGSVTSVVGAWRLGD